MGLIANLRRRRFQRRYRVARGLLLARVTFYTLDAGRKTDVLAVLEDCYRRMGDLPIGPILRSSGRYWDAYLMVSMHSLAIAPALDGEHWPLPKGLRIDPPQSIMWGFFPQPPRLLRIADRMALDFRIFDAATDAARQDLQALGIDLAKAEGDSLDAVHHFAGGGCGRPVTWREWWQSKA